jgi:hypothetical protein
MQDIAVRLGRPHRRIDYRVGRYLKKQQLRGAELQELTGQSRLSWQWLVQKRPQHGIDFPAMAEGGQQQRGQKSPVAGIEPCRLRTGLK